MPYPAKAYWTYCFDQDPSNYPQPNKAVTVILRTSMEGFTLETASVVKDLYTGSLSWVLHFSDEQIHPYAWLGVEADDITEQYLANIRIDSTEPVSDFADSLIRFP